VEHHDDRPPQTTLATLEKPEKNRDSQKRRNSHNLEVLRTVRFEPKVAKEKPPPDRSPFKSAINLNFVEYRS
jgi:hypothetical protein